VKSANWAPANPLIAQRFKRWVHFARRREVPQGRQNKRTLLSPAISMSFGARIAVTAVLDPEIRDRLWPSALVHGRLPAGSA